MDEMRWRTNVANLAEPDYIGVRVATAHEDNIGECAVILQED